MKKRSKRYNELLKIFDKTKSYSLGEAVSIVKKCANTKFDETIDLSIRLNVNPKQADQNIRGTVVLPHGTGKAKKVAVITKGEKVTDAKNAGADIVGSEELIAKIAGGWLEFDVLVVTPDIMKDMGKLGKVLGPRGLMPNPKSGTVTLDIANAVKEIKLGKVEFRVDSFGIVHSNIGKISFDEKKLFDNSKTLLESILKGRPSTVKGNFVKSISISSTMGPGIKIDFNKLN